MTTESEMQAATDKAVVNFTRFDDFVNGSATEDVALDSGSIPSLKKFLTQSGYVASAADSAEASADAATISADRAESFALALELYTAGGWYDSIADGVADTSNGDGFFAIVDNRLLLVKNVADVGVVQAEIWTKAASEGDPVPIVIAIAGQSNARGGNGGGPNPYNANVFTWDAVTASWVAGGQYTALPWTRDEPDGNLGRNNYALSAAHEIQLRTGNPVYIVMDAWGGKSITQWVPETQPRYAALKTKVETALASISGKTTVDFLIWAQGEENSSDPTNRMDYATYYGNLSDLNDQLRAETWMDETTPVYAMGMSNNYDKFAPQQVIRQYCGKVNQHWVYVSMKGLKTVFEETGTGDATHWTGDSLFFGGRRIADAYLSNERSTELPGNIFWGNNTGELQPGDVTAIAGFTHLVSWDSRDETTAAITSHSSAGAIAWGKNCVSDGNYSFTLGEACTTGAAANYDMMCGKEVTADTGTNYSGGFGYQNAFTGAYYAFAAGRNHFMNDTYGAAAFGVYSANYTVSGSPMLFRVGNGISSARSNAFAVTEDGAVLAQKEYRVGSNKVVGSQGVAIADVPVGSSATVAANATAINSILARLRAHGLIAT